MPQPDKPAPRQPARRSHTGTLTRDVLVLGLIWGASVVLQRLAVAEIPPVPLMTLRLLAALAFYIPFLPRIRRGLADRPRLWRDLALLGTVNPTLCGILTALALRQASSGVVAVLVALAPMITALLARLVLKESKLRPAQIVGLGIAFLGVVLLIGTRSTGLESSDQGDIPAGQALALTVALLMAGGTVYARLRLVATDPLAASAGQIGSGLLLTLPLLLVIETFFRPIAVSGAAWIAVVLSGAVGLSASFVLFLAMIERHGPTAALLALNVMPVAAAALGAILLGETLTPFMVAGASLVLGGVYVFTRG